MPDDHDPGTTSEEENEVSLARSRFLAAWVLPSLAPLGGLVLTGYLFQSCLVGRACLMYLYFWPYSFIISLLLWVAGVWYRENRSMTVYLLPITATLVVLWYLWLFQKHFTL